MADELDIADVPAVLRDANLFRRHTIAPEVHDWTLALQHRIEGRNGLAVCIGLWIALSDLSDLDLFVLDYRLQLGLGQALVALRALVKALVAPHLDHTHAGDKRRLDGVVENGEPVVLAVD